MQFDSLKALSAKDRCIVLDALSKIALEHTNQAIPTNLIIEAESKLPQHLKDSFLNILGEY